MALYLETPERFGAAMKHLREKRGMSRYALAKLSGMTLQSVCRIESLVRSPNLDTALRILAALGMSLAIAPRPPKEDA